MKIIKYQYNFDQFPQFSWMTEEDGGLQPVSRVYNFKL